jgi:hypothetical protein
MSLMRDSFLLTVLGDLHLEDDMSAHEQAREDCLCALRELSLLDQDALHALRQRPAGELSVSELELLLDAKREGELLDAHLVSLGDLGRKDIRHEPGDAGTTKCFEDAKAYFDGFAPLPLSIITGNRERCCCCPQLLQSGSQVRFTAPLVVLAFALPTPHHSTPSAGCGARSNAPFPSLPPMCPPARVCAYALCWL